MDSSKNFCRSCGDTFSTSLIDWAIINVNGQSSCELVCEHCKAKYGLRPNVIVMSVITDVELDPTDHLDTDKNSHVVQFCHSPNSAENGLFGTVL